MRQLRHPQYPLVGRAAELARIGELLDAIAPATTAPRGAAVVVCGEPGVGKSVLLTAARELAAARGFRVLACAGVLIESDLPYSGLHQLLRPVLSGAAGDALGVALGLRDGDIPGLHQVAMAVLELLTDHEAPVLLLADDVQWLDRETTGVLAFVARRIADERVVLLASTRDAGPAGGLREAAADGRIVLGGLDAEAAAILLRAHVPGPPAPWRDRVLAMAHGNPLALVELATALARSGDFTPAELPLTDRLERVFGMRVRDLPPGTRMLLLAAALHDREDETGIVVAAVRAGGLPVTADDLTPAAAAGLLEPGGGLRFRHPLIRSAVRHSATAAQRQRTHAGLAEVLAGDQDRQVWHLAAACAGPDETVAAALERAATRAVRRGAPDAACAALERAARLSPDRDDRVRRLIAAADIGFGAGGPRFARLVTELDALVVDPVSRARLEFWQQELLRQDWSTEEAVIATAEMALRLHAAGHPEQAVDVITTAAVRCWWISPAPPVRQRVIAAVRDSGLLTVELMRASLLVQVEPETYAAEFLSRLAESGDEVREPPDLMRLGFAASAAGDMSAVVDLFDRATDGLRRQGRLGLLAQALAAQAWAGLRLGRPELTVTTAAESLRLAEETGQPRWAVMARLAEAVVAGRRGDRPAADATAAEAEAALLRSGVRPLLAMVEFARGTAALGAGEFATAFDRLWMIFDPSAAAHQPSVRAWALPDLVEAAVYSGRVDQVRQVHAEMTSLAERAGWPLLRIAVLCTAPLIAADPAPAFAAATAYDLGGWPWHRARLLLAHGVWLRRKRRIVASRESLRAARRLFRDLGAVPWAARADAELVASGERLRARTVTDREALTPQELQIARMAATGLTNREIGERLFISHRTVRTHLYRIFPKLDVTSRSELGRALGESGRSPSTYDA
ncbi:LuxR family transcriptional regulator [Actinoplanes sp. NBRC 101535]|uniref:helix-turn-helix transcriptional regulator n=1 Tax=Actinoplanes sp. NBRC 101535 TaxID=3032196 RepID=UPI0025543A7F|nr:LuxR family transcriptional regulator [Actinoplanes sp. NBRC 101535]